VFPGIPEAKKLAKNVAHPLDSSVFAMEKGI
jgi:hypothetical protein